MFGNHSFSGARIKNLTKKIEVMEDKVDSHIVIMVGTNNLRSDGTQLIMRKYEDLVRK